MIAVTQHDHYYTGKNEEELSAMATRDHVHEGLLEVGYMVPKQQIVIVSGEALLLVVRTYKSRLLKFSIWRLPATSTRVRGDGGSVLCSQLCTVHTALLPSTSSEMI